MKNKTCFVISPIGNTSSTTRTRSDKILKHVIKPVCVELGFNAYRADEIHEPGLISKRIIKDIIESDLIVADLTEHNPNVFYELAIRHFTGKPIVQLIEQTDTLPFDVYDTSTIKIDHTDIDSIENAKDKLRKYINSVMIHGRTETPITTVLDSIGMTIAYGPNRATKEEQLLDLVKKVFTELDQSKKERNLLIKKMAEREAKFTRDSDNEHLDELSVGGVWNSNNGKLLLTQTGDFVSGEYQFNSGEYIGEIFGKIVDGLVLFEWNWTDGSKEGIGFWHVGESEMNGEWFHRSECDLSLNDLLTNPSIIESLRNTSDHDWHLYRDS